LRSPHETLGHPCLVVPTAPLPGPDFARACAGDVAEDTTERTEAFPPRLERDVRNGDVGVAQQCRGPFNASCEQVTMRGHAESFLERAREVGRRDAAHASEPRNRPGLVRRGIDDVLCAQQPAYQRGVLAHVRLLTFADILDAHSVPNRTSDARAESGLSMRQNPG